MKRFYRLASPEGGGAEEHVDYARGEGLLESSGSEDEESDVEEEELELGGKKKYGYVPSDSEENEDEDEDEGMEVELDEGSDDEGQLRVNLSEDEEEVELAEDEEEEEGVDATTRIAAVNLDWDHLRASDLFTIFNSFIKAPQNVKDAASAKPVGKLLSVRIYPSEFGKERMAQEDEAGPGGGIFKTAAVTKPKSKTQQIRNKESEAEDSADDDEAMEEDENDDAKSLSDDGLDAELDDLEMISDVESEVSDAGSDDIDMTKLRQYQLERLRYYYAIATFTTVEAAQIAHDQLDGTEFERTANIMDLSYVPEGMEFDEDSVQ